MKVEIELFSELSDQLVILWLKEHRKMTLEEMKNPLEIPSGIKLLAAFQELLRYCGALGDE